MYKDLIISLAKLKRNANIAYVNTYRNMEYIS